MKLNLIQRITSKNKPQNVGKCCYLPGDAWVDFSTMTHESKLVMSNG